MQPYTGSKLWLPYHATVHQKIWVPRYLPEHTKRKAASRKTIELIPSPILEKKKALTRKQAGKRHISPAKPRTYKVRPTTHKSERRRTAELLASPTIHPQAVSTQRRQPKRILVAPSSPKHKQLIIEPRRRVIRRRRPVQPIPVAFLPVDVPLSLSPISPSKLPLNQELPPSPLPSPVVMPPKKERLPITPLDQPRQPTAWERFEQYWIQPQPLPPENRPTRATTEKPFSPIRAPPVIYRAPEVYLSPPKAKAAPKKSALKQRPAPQPEPAAEWFAFDEEYNSFPAHLLQPVVRVAEAPQITEFKSHHQVQFSSPHTAVVISPTLPPAQIAQITPGAPVPQQAQVIAPVPPQRARKGMVFQNATATLVMPPQGDIELYTRKNWPQSEAAVLIPPMQQGQAVAIPQAHTSATLFPSPTRQYARVTSPMAPQRGRLTTPFESATATTTHTAYYTGIGGINVPIYGTLQQPTTAVLVPPMQQGQATLLESSIKNMPPRKSNRVAAQQLRAIQLEALTSPTSAAAPAPSTAPTIVWPKMQSAKFVTYHPSPTVSPVSPVVAAAPPAAAAAAAPLDLDALMRPPGWYQGAGIAVAPAAPAKKLNLNVLMRPPGWQGPAKKKPIGKGGKIFASKGTKKGAKATPLFAKKGSKKSTSTAKPATTKMPNFIWRTGGTQRQRMWGGSRGSGRMRYQAKWMGSIPQQAAWQRIASGPGSRMPKRRNYTYKTRGGRAQHAFREAEAYTHENLRGLVSMPYMHSHPGYLRQIGHRFSETRPLARAYKRVWGTPLPVGASRAPAITPNVYYHPVRSGAPRKKRATGVVASISRALAPRKKKRAPRKKAVVVATPAGPMLVKKSAPKKKATAKKTVVVSTPAGPMVAKVSAPKKKSSGGAQKRVYLRPWTSGYYGGRKNQFGETGFGMGY